MKKYLLRASGIAAMAVVLSTSVFAQSDDKEKSKNKLGDDDVIVITKKGGKDSRVTIEVRDGEVTVNGKPLDEYKDGDVIIRRSRSASGTSIYSPFRQGQGSWQSIEGTLLGEGATIAIEPVVVLPSVAAIWRSRPSRKTVTVTLSSVLCLRMAFVRSS